MEGASSGSWKHGEEQRLQRCCLKQKENALVFSSPPSCQGLPLAKPTKKKKKKNQDKGVWEM